MNRQKTVPPHEGTLFGNTEETALTDATAWKACEHHAKQGAAHKADRTGHDSIHVKYSEQVCRDRGQTREQSSGAGAEGPEVTGNRGVASFSSGQ